MNRANTYFKIALKKLQHTLLVWLLAFVAGLSVSGNSWALQATSVSLPDVPLFVSLNAVPNIFIEMDDSGSMDWTILTPWHFTACMYDANLDCATIANSGLFFDATGEGNFRNFEYVFEAADDAYGTGCDNNRNVIELCDNRDPDDFDWRVKSSDLNVLYYNPGTTYKPWPGYGPAEFGSARSYPDPALDGFADIRDLNGFVYHYWLDTHGFTGARPGHDNRSAGANGIIDQWDSNVKVTVNGGSFTCELVTYNPDADEIHQNFEAIGTNDPRCLAAVGGNTSPFALQANIANWYQYYRRRTMVARASVATVVADLADFRYGFGMINDQDVFVEMPDPAVTNFSTHNDTLVETFLEYQQQAAGTPLRRGLERIGRYYDGDLNFPSPIVEACQKNFTILFTDGFWNGGDPNVVAVDVDGDGATINGEDVTLADVAKFYYDRDLSAFPNIVPTDPFDSASHQHMVSFTIGFGVTGDLRDTDGDGWPNPALDDADLWYFEDSGNNERRVDDLWHAAWNSRGKYISARRPEDLISGLRAAIANIGDRIGGAASGSANGGSISSDSKIFQAKFDASDWHGELLALEVDPVTGVLGGVAWEAGGLLNTRSAASRKIFTTNGSGNGVNFAWASIGTSQRELLNIDPQTGDPDSKGEDRLLYLRGNKSNEGSAVGDFRERDNILGDLGHSDPEYVGAPPFFYSFNSYTTFATNNKNRRSAVYVGGNDGMLHAFAEDTGEELFAFIPGYLMGKLNKLTDQEYQHDFYVDGSPTYGDVYINGSWKSVLAGSLRSGGQAVYALDVTDPESFTAGNVLWEFSDKDDADMGYVYGQPQIKKMQNGKWAVIFTSGYNNAENDLNPSTTGNGFIFVLYIEDGINGWGAGDYVKIPIPGADGLAEPAVADVDGDSKADFIYSGDLSGQMWKIDVTSANSANWGVAFSGNPLFTATSANGDVQPITTRPAIKRHPLGIQSGVLVLFGTGRYLALADDATTGVPTQSVYSIWDHDGYYNGRTTPAVRNNYGAFGFDRATDLQNPAMTIDSGSGTRVISGNSSLVWFDTGGLPKDRGWVVDLPIEGERIVREIVLRDDLAFFVTLIPEDDVCSAGGTGWLMAIDATSGTAPRFPVFDIDGDNQVTGADVVGSLVPGDGANPVGLGSLSIPNLPAFLFDDRPMDLSGNPVQVFPPAPNTARGCGSEGARAYTYTTQTNGSVTMVTTAAQPLSCGRQSWKQTR